MNPGSPLWRRAVAAAFVLVFAAVAIVTAARALTLARSQSPLDAVGERRFHRWADRDPRLLPWLAEAGARTPAGEAVVATCAPECETRWFWVMAAYSLPRQAVVAAKTEGESRRILATKIERTRAGLRIIPRGSVGAVR